MMTTRSVKGAGGVIDYVMGQHLFFPLAHSICVKWRRGGGGGGLPSLQSSVGYLSKPPSP